jgi:hypothetical protein
MECTRPHPPINSNHAVQKDKIAYLNKIMAKAALIAIQEAHGTTAMANEYAKQFPSWLSFFSAAGNPAAGGVLIFMHRKLLHGLRDLLGAFASCYALLAEHPQHSRGTCRLPGPAARII